MAIKSIKAPFILSLPTSMAAPEVVKKAKAAGISLTPAYVYKVRKGKKGAGPKATAAKPAAQAKPVAAARRETRPAACRGFISRNIKRPPYSGVSGYA